LLKNQYEIDKIIGNKVKERRNEISMTQSELGDLLGISFHQISKYESGINRIPCSRIYAIAQALDVSCQYFFDFDKPNKLQESNFILDGVYDYEQIANDMLLSINSFKTTYDLFLKETILNLSKEILATLEKIKER
jgi:transcriptional regulator with XRE-family HTH domain